MRVSVEKSGPLERKMNVVVPSDKVAGLMKDKVKEYRQGASIKGFRKGHIPADYIQKEYGAQIRQDVLREVINASFTEALTQEGLTPCATPDFKTVKDEDGADVEYEVSFEVYPELELKAFADIEIKKPEAKLEDKDITEMLEKLRDQMADWETVERAAASSDQVKADVTRLVTGIEEPTENKDVRIVLDKEMVLPEIVAGLEGVKAGEERTITLTYPEDWNEPEIAGKAATLTITIAEVQEKKPIDDEALVKRMGSEEEAGLDGLKAKLTEGMEKEADRARFEKMKEALMTKLLDQYEFDVPQSLLTQELKSVNDELSQSGRSSDDTPEVLANKRVRLGLILNEVIKSKQIKPDGMKVQAEIERIARQFGSSPEIIKAYYSNRELMRSVEHTVLLDDAINAILNEVTQTPETMTYEALVNGAE